MKNYEVKYATKEFAGGKVKISNKRLAYLVPNMFGKLKSGFFKKVSSIVAVYQEEMQIKQFEQDIKNNVEIDINKYHIPDSNFNDGEKRIGLKISEAGSKFFKKGLVTVFDLLSKLIDN